MRDVAKDNKPSREFLAMLIILLKKSQKETGKSLVEFLEDFENDHPEIGIEQMDVDPYDDNQLRRAIHKYMNVLYPPETQKNKGVAVEDLNQDDKTVEELLDDEPAPMVQFEKVEDEEG